MSGGELRAILGVEAIHVSCILDVFRIISILACLPADRIKIMRKFIFATCWDPIAEIRIAQGSGNISLEKLVAVSPFFLIVLVWDTAVFVFISSDYMCSTTYCVGDIQTPLVKL